MASSSSAPSCAECTERLVFENDDGLEVPDDLFLSCGCHFHWECLFEHCTPIAKSGSCPSCNKQITSPAADGTLAIITQYTNEGGFQPDFDIYRRILEDAFYEQHTDKLPGRAFLAQCSEGDVDSMMQLYVEHAFGAGDEADEDDEMDEDGAEPAAEAMSAPEMLRHQDPFSQMESGLHMAIANDHQHIAFLILFLASSASLDHLPQELKQFVASIPRPQKDLLSYPDVRSLQTSMGKLPKHYALEKGGIWEHMANSGLLDSPTGPN